MEEFLWPSKQMDLKSDANNRIFWVINKGDNVGNQDGVGSVAGRSPSNPTAAEFLQPESYTVGHFQFMYWFHYTSTKLD